MTKLVFDRPSGSGLYDGAICALDNLTGFKWGFIKGRRRVQYLSSIQLPIKICVLWGKSYEKNYRWAPDVEIVNKFPSKFDTREIWIDVITTELQLKLIKLNINSDIMTRVKLWRPSSHPAAMILHAEEQNKKHLNISVYSTEYNVYLESCGDECG